MLSRIWLFEILWTVACQARLSTGFSRQEYWRRLLFPPPEGLPNPGIELVFPALAGRFFTIELPAAAAKSLQSCPILCDPIDGSVPGSSVPGILQARTLLWVAISFSNAWKWKVKMKSLSRVLLFTTPWTVAYQAPPCMGFSRQEYWVCMKNSWLVLRSHALLFQKTTHTLHSRIVSHAPCQTRWTGASDAPGNVTPGTGLQLL